MIRGWRRGGAAFGVVVGAVFVTALAGAPTLVPEPAAATSRPRPAIEPLPARGEIGMLRRFTVSARVTPKPANPFDPAQIDARVVFRGPDGAVTPVIAFWYQGYTRALVDGREVLTAVGDPHWKARFAPPAAGRWQWWWEVRTPDGIARTPERRLVVTPSRAHGFIRKSADDPRYLVRDDGSSYFANGENLGWYDQRGTFAYDDWLGALGWQGATFARVWMPSWAMGIEWSDTGLGDYANRLDRAWQLDRVLDTAKTQGIAVELALLNHGAFSTEFNSEWAANPYNAANGGPLAQPADFFTSPVAKSLFKQRLRYIVARWGANTNLLAWELWNEVDLVTGYDGPTVAAWHREMAGFLRELDPADHLVSTSFALFFQDPQVWSGGALDFTQLHFYSRSPGLEILTDLADDVTRWQPERVATYGQPVLFAELGVDSQGPAETVAADPEGIGVHDGLWAGLIGEGFGTAMPWWWDNVVATDPFRYYPMFGSVARFVDGVRWDRERFVGSAPAVGNASARPVVAHMLTGDRTTLVWLKDHGYQWNAPARVEVADARVPLGSLGPGTWCGAWWNTWWGAWVDLDVVEAGPGAEVVAPPFVGDVALRLQRC